MDELLTAKQVSEWLRVHQNTIYVWVTRREIPFLKLPGNTTRFPRIKIETWLQKRFANGKLLERGIYL